MIWRLLVASGTISALLSGIWPAAAQEEPPVDCENTMVQFDLNICSQQDYEAADKQLNAAYKVAMEAMTDTDKQLADLGANYAGAVGALKKAQRAWIDYRDGQCVLAGFEARGGSAEPMLVSGCLAEMTRKRTAELKALTEGSGN